MSGNYKARIPRQIRGIETKKRVLEEAIKLFSDKGYHKTSSNEIAGRAGVPIGSFYAYFKDKKHIFLEAVKEYNRLVSEKIGSGISSFPGNIDEDILHFLLKNLVEAHRILHGFYREIEVMKLYDPEIGRLMKEQKNDVTELVTNILLINKDRIKTDNLEAASLIISGAVENVVHAVAFSEEKIDGERYINELVSMLIKYLL